MFIFQMFQKVVTSHTVWETRINGVPMNTEFRHELPRPEVAFVMGWPWDNIRGTAIYSTTIHNIVRRFAIQKLRFKNLKTNADFADISHRRFVSWIHLRSCFPARKTNDPSWNWGVFCLELWRKSRGLFCDHRTGQTCAGVLAWQQ